MCEELNFSNQFYPQINSLKTWVKDHFYPYLKSLKSRSDTFRVYDLNLSENGFGVARSGGKSFNTQDLFAELSHFKNKSGIYGIEICKDNHHAFLYVGKSKNLAVRVRQHLTGKNKNGSELAISTANKYADILNLIKIENIKVRFFVWTSKKLTESSNIDYELGVLEALVIAESKADLNIFNEKLKLSLEHLNFRTG